MRDVDVLIVGAGLSGIGAAYRLQSAPRADVRDPGGPGGIGGTWDLFRFPGIRSDSDMFTLGYPFRPWTGAKAIADGASILRYLRDTARSTGSTATIRFGRTGRRRRVVDRRRALDGRGRAPPRARRSS